MHERELSIADLIDEADALPERGAAGAALSAISRDVSDDVVSVTVNLNGKLIGLELSEQAMRLPPAELAERISRATAEAAAAALDDGLQVITDTCGPIIAAAISDHNSLAEARVLDPKRGGSTVDRDDDEELTPQSWAIAWD